MLKAYVLTSWRHLLRNKSYAIINILGLSLGIACGILIFVLVRFHLSFDRFHHDTDRIFRVNTEFHEEGVSRNGAVPGPLGKAVRNDYPFSEKVAMVVTYPGTLISLPGEKEVKKFEEDRGVAYAEPEYFDIFTFPLAQGTYPTTPNSAAITRNIAKKYFGTEEVLGKTIRFNNQTDFIIRGVLKDLPPNTDRNQEIYLSYANLKDYNAWLASDSSWGGVYSGCQCFLRLRPGVTQTQVERAFPSMSKKYYKGDDVASFQFKLQPLSNIHFNTDLDGYADKRYLWAIGFVGLFLIITASVNFINLATAQALNRSREVGVRKVLGSEPIHVFWQFMAETALISFFALLVGLGLAWAGLPALNGLLHAQMSLFTSWSLVGFLAASFVLVVFLAGSYPGLVLARFPPALALKGKLDQSHIGGFSLRRVLVVLQFSISQLLIIGTLVIARQIYFSEHTDLGFTKDGIVTVPLPVDDPVKMNTLRDRFQEIPGVNRVSLCYHPPAASSNNNTDVRFNNRPKAEVWEINVKMADDQYIPLFGLQLIAGRNIFRSDTTTGYVINQTTLHKLHAGTAPEILGQQLDVDGVKAPIVGVVKDFNNYSFRGEIAPVAIFSAKDRYRDCALLINMNKVKPVLTAMERIWNETYPEYVYSNQFLDERINRFYALDNVMLKLIETFAGIAIFIGCLGLYGLVSFMAVRKTKEIGVRKVLGAGMTQILWLFGREFTRLLVIAFVIAAPIAGWAMYKYLEAFKYRITLGWAVFVPSLAGTFLIAVLTVGYRSWKAASMRPIKSLRSE